MLDCRLLKSITENQLLKNKKKFAEDELPLDFLEWYSLKYSSWQAEHLQEELETRSSARIDRSLALTLSLRRYGDWT